MSDESSPRNWFSLDSRRADLWMKVLIYMSWGCYAKCKWQTLRDIILLRFLVEKHQQGVELPDVHAFAIGIQVAQSGSQVPDLGVP